MVELRMRSKLPILILAAGLVVAAAPLAVVVEPSREELEQNRGRLDKLKGGDSERYQRLCRDAKTFNGLPPETQKRLRRLDSSVHEKTTATQAQLLRAAERYALWLERLPVEERTKIETASDAAQRLARIKEIRQQQWLENLPQPVRDRIQNAAANDRPAQIKKVREEESQRKEETRLAALLADDAVQDFINDRLMPRITKEEKEKLNKLPKTDERPTAYARTLVELTDKNLFKLLLPAEGKPSKMEDFPDDLPKRFRKKLTDSKKLESASGKWPDFALALVELLRDERHHLSLSKRLKPRTPKDFERPTREFLEQILMNPNSGVLDRSERNTIQKAEGDWPEYPRALQSVIEDKHLSVPGVTLPGPSRLWDRFREKKPASTEEATVASDSLLLDFARRELSPSDRADLHISLTNPFARERLQLEYVKRHPEQWQKLLENDQQKRLQKK